MRFVDAHVHLSDLEDKVHVDRIIEDARKMNVVALVANSTNLQTCLQNISLAKRYPKLVYVALGIHPWNAMNLLPNELEHTVSLILNHKQYERVVAIGEIGLDHKYLKRKQKELISKQYEVFSKMLQLGEKLSLPMIIHSRGTTSEIVNMLSSYHIKKVLLHWFSQPIKLLSEIINRGYFVSEGLPTVYSNNTRDIVSQVPLTHLLTETDGPVRFFKPPFKGEMAEPSLIPLVVEAIAEIKHKEKTEVAEQIFQNFTKFFEIEQKW